MPVTQARLPGFQSAKSARWYQALIGPIQATGSAGGFDLSSKKANARQERVPITEFLFVIEYLCILCYNSSERQDGE